MAKDLTDKQKQFIHNIVYGGMKPADAAVKAGYSDKTLAHLITDALRDEIVAETERMLATHAADAARTLVTHLDPVNAIEPGSEKRITSATQILDRIGLTKKERPQQLQQGAIGIVFLPAKQDDGN